MKRAVRARSPDDMARLVDRSRTARDMSATRSTPSSSDVERERCANGCPRRTQKCQRRLRDRKRVR